MGGGRPGAEPYWRIMARAIIDAGRPMSSIELAEAANLMPAQARQRRQTRTNSLISDAQHHHGEPFRHAGYGRSAYKNTPYALWDITPHGRALLAQPWPPPPSPSRIALQAGRDLAARRRQMRAALPELAAQRGWDWATPPAERAVAARELRDMGYYLPSIGHVFGVTGEMIRLYLLPGDERERLRERNKERNKRYYRERKAAASSAPAP
jgi:hypothetical protein